MTIFGINYKYIHRSFALFRDTHQTTSPQPYNSDITRSTQCTGTRDVCKRVYNHKIIYADASKRGYTIYDSYIGRS